MVAEQVWGAPGAWARRRGWCMLQAQGCLHAVSAVGGSGCEWGEEQ